MHPDLNQIDLVVRDIDASVEFYRTLGIEIPDEAIWRTSTGAHHVDLTMPGGLHLHLDSPALAKAYNAGWMEPTDSASRNVLTFRVSSPEEVDRIHASLAKRGYTTAQEPYRAFWGSRYAIVEDPDGNHIGLMSPSDPAQRVAPPDL